MPPDPPITAASMVTGRVRYSKLNVVEIRIILVKDFMILKTRGLDTYLDPK